MAQWAATVCGGMSHCVTNGEGQFSRCWDIPKACMLRLIWMWLVRWTWWKWWSTSWRGGEDGVVLCLVLHWDLKGVNHLLVLGAWVCYLGACLCQEVSIIKCCRHRCSRLIWSFSNFTSCQIESVDFYWPLGRSGWFADCLGDVSIIITVILLAKGVVQGARNFSTLRK